MTFPISLVVIMSLFVSPILGDISPPSPVLYLYMNELYRGAGIYSPNFTGAARSPIMMNYGTGLEGWHLENVSFVSGSLAGGAMIVNNSQLYTYGIASLAGIGVDSTDMILPTLAQDFYPETIVNVRSTWTAGLVLLANGSSYSWGSGEINQYQYEFSARNGPVLGQPQNATFQYPLKSLTVKPVKPVSTFKAIYSGVGYSWFAIGLDGSFYTFGLNEDRIVNNGPNTADSAEPGINLTGISPPQGMTIRHIGGQYRAIAFLSDGSWFCWGGYTNRNACGQGGDTAISGANPRQFSNPYANITFTKMLSYMDRVTYALANDYTLWGWGSSTYLFGAPFSPYCYTTWCSTHQIRMPPGRETIKIVDIWGSYWNFFILNEIGEIYDTGRFGEQDYTYSWKYIPFEVPNGHQIDFSKSDSIGQYGGCIWLTKLVDPCPVPRPYFGGYPINCVDAKWRIFRPIINSTFTISVPVQTYSNVTIISASTMVVDNYSNLDDPVITISGCIEGLDLLQISFNLSDAQLETESSEILPITLFEFDSRCQYDSLPNTSVIQRNPRIIALSNVTMTTNGTKSQYVVSFTKSLNDDGLYPTESYSPLDHSPNTTSSNDFELGSDLTLGSDSPLVIPGNITIVSPVTIKVPNTGDSTIPVLSVGGCIKGMELLTIEISLSKEDLLSDKIDPKTVIEMESTCSVAVLPVATVSQPKLCKKAQAEVVVGPLETRIQLSVLFKISKVSCNTWWIILVSVICGLAVIAVGVTLLIFLNPRLRMKCQPYVLTRQ